MTMTKLEIQETVEQLIKTASSLSRCDIELNGVRIAAALLATMFTDDKGFDLVEFYQSCNVEDGRWL